MFNKYFMNIIKLLNKLNWGLISILKMLIYICFVKFKFLESNVSLKPVFAKTKLKRINFRSSKNS